MAFADRILKLPDGRNLGYSVLNWEAPASAPVILYSHGWPSSRLEGTSMAVEAASRGMRFICVDKPGIGTSTFNPKGTFSSYVADVLLLLDHLGISKVVKMGMSAGGPYAMAFGILAPHRTQAVVLLSSMTHTIGPDVDHMMSQCDLPTWLMDRIIRVSPRLVRLVLLCNRPFWLAAPWFMRLLASWRIAKHQRTATAAHHSSSTSDNSDSSSSAPLLSGSPPLQPQTGSSSSSNSSRSGGGRGGSFLKLPRFIFQGADLDAVLEQPRLLVGLLPQLLRQSLLQGVQGLAHDMQLTSWPWDIRPQQLTHPKVLLFQGLCDTCVVPAMGRYLASLLPTCQATYFENEGHLSLLLRRPRDVFDKLEQVLQ